MTNGGDLHHALWRLIAEDAVGQLRRRDGRMAALGSEDGALKLDWVEAVARLLADPVGLEEVEAEARAIRDRGIRHIIWAGMGGSVLTVRVMCELGFCGGDVGLGATAQHDAAIAIHPLDSTDPAALNAIVRAIAAAKQLALPLDTKGSEPAYAAFLRALLVDVMMVGVSMGMTSEEPITHLAWFTELLEQASLSVSEHLLVMTLPGSYLDAFAQAQGAPSRPLQLDGGTGTGGRMSAPGTRVFLLPAALYLTGRANASAGTLRAALQQAWDEHGLDRAATHPETHPFVRLAAALCAASREGACRLFVTMPQAWSVLVSWLEQLMEESLGKGGKGVVVFDDQPLNTSAPHYRQDGVLRVRVVTERLPSSAVAPVADDRRFMLSQPALASTEPRERLAALAASFLGWQLSMALYGYLHDIPFAGQPAVENYKARARALRTQGNPLRVASSWQPTFRAGSLVLLASDGFDIAPVEPAMTQPAAVFARVLRAAASAGDKRAPQQHSPLAYLDITINGEGPDNMLSLLDERARTIGNMLLGVPVKLRRAPAAYHSTEQSEMDGPAALVSLRLVARDSEACLAGSYTTDFLQAQAVSTWQAMNEVGRPCCLLVIDGSLDDAHEQLSAFLTDVERELRTA